MFKRLAKFTLLLWLLSAVLLVLLAIFGDTLAKPFIQKEAQKHIPAELSFSDLQIDWLKQEVVLEQLELKSLYGQKGNNVQLASAKVQLDVLNSWQQRDIRIQSVNLENLNYIIDHPVSVAGNRIALPSAKLLLSQRLDEFDEQIQKAKSDLEKASEQWQGQLGDVLSEDRVQDYRDQIGRWRYAQGAERIQNLARIEASLRGELDAVSQIERTMRRNRNQQRQNKKRITGMPQIQSKRLLDPRMVSQQFGEFGSEVVGRELRQPLVQLINFYAQLDAVSQQLPAPVQLGELRVTGNFEFNGQGSQFALSADNIELSKDRQRMLIDLKGDGMHGGSFVAALGYAEKVLSASLDLRAFGVQDLKVGVIEIGEVSAPLQLNKAVLDGALVLELSKTQIKGELVAIVEPAIFQDLPEKLPDMGDALAQVLKSTNAFDMQLLLSGHNRAPRIKVKSSLDGIFSPEFLEQVQAQAALAQTELEGLIQERYGDDINKLTALGEQFDQLPNILAERKTALRDLIQQINSLQSR